MSKATFACSFSTLGTLPCEASKKQRRLSSCWPAHLDVKLFELFFARFTTGCKLICEVSDFLTVKKALINEFEEKEGPKETILKVIVATIDPFNLASSMQYMDPLFTRAEFNEKAKFGLLRNYVMRVK